MTQSEQPAERTFPCEHCGGEIQIPYDLPPTSAPCPHCQQLTTSPPPPAPAPVAAPPSEPAVPEYGRVAAPASTDVSAAGGLGQPLAPLSDAPTPESLNLAPLMDVAPPGPVVNEPGPVVPVQPPAPVAAEVPSPPAVDPSPSVLDMAAPGPVAEPAPPVQVSEPAAEPAPVASPERFPESPPASVVQTAPSAGAVGGTAMLDDDDLRDEDGPGVVPVGKQEKSRGRMPGVLVAFLILLLVIAGLVALGMHFLRQEEGTVEARPKVDRVLVERNRYLREGWKADATACLRGFLEADTVEDRAGRVMGGLTRLEEMRQFYAGDRREGADTPLAAFSHFDLQLSDRERGLFLMRYERPAQFNMREFFRPVAPLEVQYDVAEPGLLLSSFAMLENFATDPVRVMAFFKKEGDEMRLDWDVFVQTKYRMLKSFSSYPIPGQRRTFRVIVEEDLSGVRDVDPQVERIYRLSDPANSDDHVKVAVPVNSELGEVLAVLNWVGLVVDEKPSRTATVVLKWTSDREPQLKLDEIVCWEFVGLGGVPGNATPTPVTPPAPAPAPVPVPPAPTPVPPTPAPVTPPEVPPAPPAGVSGGPQ